MFSLLIVIVLSLLLYCYYCCRYCFTVVVAVVLLSLYCYPVQFLVGVKGQGTDSTSLYFLLESLLSLQRYHDCVEVGVCCCLQLLQHQQHCSDGWAGAVKNIFMALDRCLKEEEPHRDVCQGVGGARLVKQLVVCVLRVMDSVYDMADNLDYFYSMPVVLPWKIFHKIIDK